MGLNENIDAIHRYQYRFPQESYNDIIRGLAKNDISSILINNNLRDVVTVQKGHFAEGVDMVQGPLQESLRHSVTSGLGPGPGLDPTLYHISHINPEVVDTIILKASENLVPIDFINFTPDSIVNVQQWINGFFAITSYVFPLFIIASIFATFNNIRNTVGGSNRPNPGFFGSFSKKDKEQKKIDQLKQSNVTLQSWAGSPEVVDECREIISYLENKELYKQVGARMPRGILLEGPPGTGKTLLAKAIATETNSTFFSKSGSEFVELFVGMGAAKVRELFDEARQARPSIIFIDEIDAVGKQRSSTNMLNGGNDEREQTLNQILYEMDGFNDNEDLVVMAATNRKDTLDKALLRPGRFDRIVRIPLPDRDSRRKILELYLSGKPLSEDIDINGLAELTDGLSGAEIQNLVNEAAILTVRNGDTRIGEQALMDSFEKGLVGLIRKNNKKDMNTGRRVAIHEIGHSLLALRYPALFDFKKVSVQSTYNGAGGYTIFSEKPEVKEGGLYTKEILKKRLIITLGGKAAESVFYGDEEVSLGATQDLAQANRLANQMITQFGMGKELNVYHMPPADSSFMSEYIKGLVDKESLLLVNEAYTEAKRYLVEQEDILIGLAYLLQNNTVLYKKDMENVLTTL